MRQEVDGLFFETAEPVNLMWVREYGTVFRIWDHLRSGNLCLGVSGAYGKLFIKYAGVRTLYGSVSPSKAVENLKHMAGCYADPPEGVLPLSSHGAVNGGREWALIFPFLDGNSADLRTLPLLNRFETLDRIFAAHAALETENGLCAMRFDQSHVLLDEHGTAWLTDLDDYALPPVPAGETRLPENIRFAAPEETKIGASADFKTTVFRMGVLALWLLADIFPADRRRGYAFPLFDTAVRATDPFPENRFPAASAFLQAWREAVMESNFENI